MTSRLAAALAAGGIVWAAAGCARPLPVIDPPAPPPLDAAASEAPLPRPGAPPGRIVGALAPLPPPRFAIAVFALPAGAARGEAAPSPEWTTRILNRFDANKLPASAIAVAGPLADLDAGTQALAASAAARASDVLIAGTVSPGAQAQVRLFVRDTRDGRLIGRAEFEGVLELAVDTAIEDAVAQVNRYWFELGRGQYTGLRIDVIGVRSEPDIAAIQDALAALRGVKVTRHAGTAVDEGAANVSFEVTVEGAEEDVLAQVAKLEWTAGPARARLARAGGVVFKAVYD